MATKAKKKAQAQPEAKPCSPTGDRCPAMEMAVRAGGAKGIGFSMAVMMDWGTGETSGEMVYRFPKKIDGASYLLVNTCPWCGGSVRRPRKVAKP